MDMMISFNKISRLWFGLFLFILFGSLVYVRNI